MEISVIAAGTALREPFNAFNPHRVVSYGLDSAHAYRIGKNILDGRVDYGWQEQYARPLKNIGGPACIKPTP